ncbi:hypothetical protein ACL9RL_07235 [Plantibacter sp. Mn2098]|uniref:hypothetical protein n=1 Tax=Plantibacter sp. Mn2098 TaxID=3395266 RepID=UPI003BBAEA7C
MTTPTAEPEVTARAASSSAESLPGSDLHTAALAVFETMYRGYLDRDTARIDALLDDGFTMFDSASFSLVVGFEELAVLRGGRGASSSGVTETGLLIQDFRVFERGADVLACFVLEVTMAAADGSPVDSELSRNTAWLTRRTHGLGIRHIHEDVWRPAGE